MIHIIWMVFPVCYLFNITSPTEWLVENNMFFPYKWKIDFHLQDWENEGKWRICASHVERNVLPVWSPIPSSKEAQRQSPRSSCFDSKCSWCVNPIETTCQAWTQRHQTIEQRVHVTGCILSSHRRKHGQGTNEGTNAGKLVERSQLVPAVNGKNDGKNGFHHHFSRIYPWCRINHPQPFLGWGKILSFQW